MSFFRKTGYLLGRINYILRNGKEARIGNTLGLRLIYDIAELHFLYPTEKIFLHVHKTVICMWSSIEFPRAFLAKNKIK